MIEKLNPDPVGQVIDGFRVFGQERDMDDRWVGADMLVDVQPIGQFFLNVVTKQHFVDEELRAHLNFADGLEALLTNVPSEEEKHPFVLNDREITDEILHRKFDGRIVERDLADCLWYQGPLPKLSA